MITATRPDTLAGEIRRKIKVRGACGHEWEAYTTKADLIEQDRGDTDRDHIRLYCPACFREGKPRNNMTPVVAVRPKPGEIRYCASAHHRVRLRRDNLGEWCGACVVAQKEKAAREWATRLRDATGEEAG